MGDTRIRRAARRSGLTVGYISRVMQGKRNPRLSTAKLIARAMNMSVDRLFETIESNRAAGRSPQQIARSRAISNGLKQRAAVSELESRAALGHVDQSAYETVEADVEIG